MWSGRKVLVRREEKAIGLLSYVKHLWLKHVMRKYSPPQQKQPVKKTVYTTSAGSVRDGESWPFGLENWMISSTKTNGNMISI